MTFRQLGLPACVRVCRPVSRSVWSCWYTMSRATCTPMPCTSLLPFLTLLSLNIVIYRRLKLAKKVSARLHSSQPHQQSATERTNLSSSTILLCTVATFLVCHSPRLLLSVYEAFMIPSILNCQAKLKVLLAREQLTHCSFDKYCRASLRYGICTRWPVSSCCK